jgi:hypothetical protein
MKLIQRDLSIRLRDLFRQAERDVLISSPYVGKEGVQLAVDNFPPGYQRDGRLVFLTDLSSRNIYQSATDPSALLSLCEQVSGAMVQHLPRLHAKVYVADNKSAIVTSANCAAGGLFRNYEYGVEVSDPSVVTSIRQDLEEYGALGARVPRERLELICTAAIQLRQLFRAANESVSQQFREAFQQRVEEAETELIRLRVGSGALHTVFGQTVLYLLRRYGRLTTEELHRHVSDIHPDLCDDSVDRIIDGKHFGKKWKHAVRSAQQQLKQRNQVSYDGEAWIATGTP